MGLHVLLSSVDSSLCFSPPVAARAALISQCYRATQNPDIHTWTSALGEQAADSVSLFIPYSFPLSRPTSSPVHLAAHLSGTIVYFGSSVPAKNQLKRVEHIRSRGPLGDSRPSDPSAASEWASVGYSVNNCSIPFHCHLNQTLKPFHGAFSRRFISEWAFVYLLLSGEKAGWQNEPLAFHLFPHWKHQAPKTKYNFRGTEERSEGNLVSYLSRNHLFTREIHKLKALF